MAKKLSKELKEKLSYDYQMVCNDYVWALADAYGWKPDSWCWIDDEVGGSISHDDMFIGFEDVRMIIENDIPEETFLEYLDYNVWCNKFGFDFVSLQDFIDGHIINEESRRMLTKKKKELDELTASIKSEF